MFEYFLIGFGEMGNNCCCCCRKNVHHVVVVNETSIRKALRHLHEKSSTLLELIKAAIEFIENIEDKTLFKNATLIIYDEFNCYEFISGHGRHRIIANLVRGSPVITGTHFPTSDQNRQITN